MSRPTHPLFWRTALELIPIGGLLLIVLVGPPVAAEAASEWVARADALYRLRGEGQVEGLARSEPIGEVVALYERAAAMDPDDLGITWKLLQALEYQGIHALPENAPERRPIFDRATEVCESAIDRVAAKLGGRDALYRATREELERRGIDPTQLAGVYLWGAFDTAAWAREHGTLAAVMAGVAGRLHEYAKQVIALDPGIREGAGYRLLAQLHISVPRVPFVTSWVDPEEAFVAMAKAEEIAPGDPHNRLFLAEVLLQVRPDRRDEAEGLLRATSRLEPRADRVAEDWELKNKADELLEIHFGP
jgi:tetratricopeptide (TPR) repeat protein